MGLFPITGQWILSERVSVSVLNSSGKREPSNAGMWLVVVGGVGVQATRVGEYNT